MVQTPKTEAVNTSSLNELSSLTVGSTATLVDLRVAILGLCPVVSRDYPKCHTVSGCIGLRLKEILFEICQ